MAAPTRVALVIGQLGAGGAERQLYELVSGIDRARFHCVVYCLSDRVSPYGPMIEEAGLALRALPRRHHFELTRLLTLAAALRKDRIELVHSFLFIANAYAWAARRLAGVPRLVTSARNCKDVGQPRQWVNHLAFRDSDAVVCNGEAVRSFVIQRYAAPAGRTVVIYNGVDLGRFPPPDSDPASPARQSGDGLVITVGRLVAQKDLVLFLEAAALVARQRPRTRFVVAGNGPCRQELQDTADRLGLAGTVTFLGERDDVPALLLAADVFWLTSSWEGLPNVLLEAMAAGRPIVARAVGACSEVVQDGVTGFLVAERDPRAFARHTLTLLADPDLAETMGAEGRRRASEKFSVARMVDATEDLYGALTSQHRSPVRVD
jgi:glycosyltransferase involved in cell wall biosynthesis